MDAAKTCHLKYDLLLCFSTQEILYYGYKVSNLFSNKHVVSIDTCLVWTPQ